MKVVIKTISALIFGVLILACNQKKETSLVVQVPEKVDIDSLESLWDESWNTGNVNLISEQMSDSAIVFENDWIVFGNKDTLLKKFIIPNSKMSLKHKFITTKISDGQSSSMAYRVGYYRFITKDSSIQTVGGTYTIVWKKDVNKWKVQVLQTGTSPKK